MCPDIRISYYSQTPFLQKKPAGPPAAWRQLPLVPQRAVCRLHEDFQTSVSVPSDDRGAIKCTTEGFPVGPYTAWRQLPLVPQRAGFPLYEDFHASVSIHSYGRFFEKSTSYWRRS